MIKECLSAIINHELDFGIKRKNTLKLVLEYYEEHELLYILQKHNNVMDDLTINFYPNVGFRCSNDVTRTGKNPICNIIQRVLNEKYKELI